MIQKKNFLHDFLKISDCMNDMIDIDNMKG